MESAIPSGGWLMVRSAPNFTSSSVSGALISKMDTTQHNRGWDLAVVKGIVNVDLVDEAPKEEAPKPPKAKGSKDKAPKDKAPKVVEPKIQRRCGRSRCRR